MINIARCHSITPGNASRVSKMSCCKGVQKATREGQAVASHNCRLYDSVLLLSERTSRPPNPLQSQRKGLEAHKAEQPSCNIERWNDSHCECQPGKTQTLSQHLPLPGAHDWRAGSCMQAGMTLEWLSAFSSTVIEGEHEMCTGLKGPSMHCALIVCCMTLQS